MPLMDIDVTGSPNTGGGTSTSTQNFFTVGGQTAVVDGSPVSSHPPCPIVPSHCAASTSNGHSGFSIGGVPVNIKGDPDTCGHPRDPSVPWFTIDSAL